MVSNKNVLDGCISRLKEIETEYRDLLCMKDGRIKELSDKLLWEKKEKDAVVADITEFAKFYRRRTICDFCMHENEEKYCSRCGENPFINDCFKWRSL